MVVRKRLDYGSRGHQIPTMPRVPSSARGKRSTRRKKDEMFAFDLLATVAGTLLADQENSSNVPNISKAAARYAKNRKSVKAEQFDEVLPLKNMAVEKCIVGSGGACVFSRHANICLAENSSTRIEADSVLETIKSNMLVKDSLFSCTISCKLGHGLGRIPEYRTYGTNGMHHPGSTRAPEANQVQQAKPDGDTTDLYSLVGSVDLDARPPALVSSNSSSRMPLCSHDKDNNSTPLYQAEVQHDADRDDDENSSRCTHPSTAGNKGYVQHDIGDNRIRKLFASKLRKAARNKICEKMSNKGSRLNFCGKDISTTRQKVQRATFKRKKLVRRHYTPSSAKEIPTEVKLRIKSLNFPELFIDVPENATIGSLKRTIMDVVTNIIEGGLRVNVLLQGKNIQDDNKTLRQAGICHGEKLDNIDFTLECEAGHNSSHGLIIPEEMDFLGADVVEPLVRMNCEEPFPDIKVSDDNQQPMQASPNSLLSDPGSVHSLVATQETSASSQAIVPVASQNLEALAIVPVCKSKQSDIGQRRIRRPFSVAEVDALVEAVEHLGTGRWRDVKMCAFDNADHRTYVDLKDKWKTLVHTASISPQQRRGEPVPQELLDRVLAAQAYWSQQQAKLQDKPPGKAPVAEICPT